ncbi:MAG: NAD-dependent epimerase/dehydratase family protein [Clostridia bacterium]|nr:NAD-dependent epimerase/dehydratase family protein [Clostridia bacterium]
MKILVIGGTGHMGKFVCEILKERGHEVHVGSRNGTAPEGMTAVKCNSSDINSLKELKSAGYDTIIEFPGFIKNVYDVFSDSVKHIIACGSLWMYGAPKAVPTPEEYQSECPFAGYAQRYTDMQSIMTDGKCLFTAIMVPNVCGPGKIPLDCLGDRDAELHKALARGEKVYLPDGPEALVSPCDAYDLATLFVLAAEQPEKSGNQFFNVGPADSAVTMSELVKIYGKIYGIEIPVEYVPWGKYKNEISPSIGHWWHFYAHMSPDDSKARNLLGYKAKYTICETLERAVQWMRDENIL